MCHHHGPPNSFGKGIMFLVCLSATLIIHSPRESKGVCFYQRWFVCLYVFVSVTTITKKIVDGFVSHFMGRFLGGKGRPSSCFVTIGRSKNSINWQLFTFYTFDSRCGKCWLQNPQILLLQGVVLSQSTFHLVCSFVYLFVHLFILTDIVTMISHECCSLVSMKLTRNNHY